MFDSLIFKWEKIKCNLKLNTVNVVRTQWPPCVFGFKFNIHIICWSLFYRILEQKRWKSCHGILLTSHSTDDSCSLKIKVPTFNIQTTLISWWLSSLKKCNLPIKFYLLSNFLIFYYIIFLLCVLLGFPSAILSFK